MKSLIEWFESKPRWLSTFFAFLPVIALFLVLIVENIWPTNPRLQVALRFLLGLLAILSALCYWILEVIWRRKWLRQHVIEVTGVILLVIAMKTDFRNAVLVWVGVLLLVPAFVRLGILPAARYLAKSYQEISQKE